jgi:formylglycine-generating enzyme required for sulfatase activity
MRLPGLLAAGLAAWLGAVGAAAAAGTAPTLAERNARLLEALGREHGLTPAQRESVRAILVRSGFAGQGNPAISVHPRTREQCLARRAERPPPPEEAGFAAICGAPHMAPLYDPRRERPEDALMCIDQYEFPDIPCEYPVVWVKAREAAQICEAIGKRLCDAHEWEGACDGRLEPPDYRFELAAGRAPGDAVALMRSAHNRAREPERRWSYGPAYRGGVCATGSRKSPGCAGGGWNACGSNTYPTGDFAQCRSPLGVYDLNGNAAEHMNLPLWPSQMASTGSRELGHTEMKGSWFVFDAFRAHEDWCRWRAPYWHGSRVLDPASHANYHLGFRCCRTLAPRPPR